MKIVTNGKEFALRWGIWPFYRYFDFESPNLWWDRNSKFYMCCWGSKEKAEYWYKTMNTKVYKEK